MRKRGDRFDQSWFLVSIVLRESTPEIRPAPLLGQHTTEVLQEWLGLDAAEIHQLGKDGII